MNEHQPTPSADLPPAGVQSAIVERTVEWIDTDASGHQHNSAIMRWVESAEAELFRRLDLADYFPSAPRVHQSINFRAKLWFGQRVSTIIWIQQLGATSLTLGFRVLAHNMPDHDGGHAADGTIVTTHVPKGSAVSTPWPDNFRSAMEAAL